MNIDEQLEALDKLDLEDAAREELTRFLLEEAESQQLNLATDPTTVISPPRNSENTPAVQAQQSNSPFPDVQRLFQEYDVQFFDGVLRQSCIVEWSKRMTLCAGICYYKRHPTKAQILQASKQTAGVESLMSLYPRCIIRLSEPLLIYRTITDLKQTLIHEMIHAYCFKFNLEKSRDGHGAVFCKFMNTINEATGLRITVYHSFNEEVEHARKHVWRCNGPCQNSKPYYGYVKRAMNRAPGPSDWWSDIEVSVAASMLRSQAQTSMPKLLLHLRPHPQTLTNNGC
eukprot:Protomagalhaensia_wolfi_Nauph_80__5210@NODE_55_length_4132_cov_174_239922_g46_i0_p1_GENE_NODE_55_length_4132_cov_174_239922_g46_i0NODE_55_length_4132_cov_174_239922_g46_i0_p1_ORF_typecomplete_len285_score38_17SprTlike/PF10263_9/6_5e25Peptidase_M76/PF09768_9/0_08Hormone_6/PF00236_18/0_93Hormone_6/PF00236_18/1_9e02_NODE_55_length_4132_cov_174_239922_g46_i08481702